MKRPGELLARQLGAATWALHTKTHQETFKINYRFQDTRRATRSRDRGDVLPRRPPCWQRLEPPVSELLRGVWRGLIKELERGNYVRRLFDFSWTLSSSIRKSYAGCEAIIRSYNPQPLDRLDDSAARQISSRVRAFVLVLRASSCGMGGELRRPKSRDTYVQDSRDSGYLHS